LTARILDGKKTAKEIRQELGTRVGALIGRGVTPRLAVILVGEDPASKVYVGNKSRSAREIGIDAFTREISASVSQGELEAIVQSLAHDPSVHGILLQLPLPKGLDPEPVVRCIPPDKDVDGLTPESVGELARGTPRFIPCTPFGIVELLHRSQVSIPGKHVVILGRSNLVGRPLANLLLMKGSRGDATVTVCHSRSTNLAELTRQGDILVAAIGQAEFVTQEMVKPGAIVVDVGINRVDDPAAPGKSRLVGDVDFERASQVAEAITPVPGGIGPMTVAMLLVNTVQAAESHVRTGDPTRLAIR